MQRRRRCVGGVSGQLVWLVLVWSWRMVEAQQAPKTDPIEVAALNTILGRWGLKASSEWNISGEPCSGFASDGIDWDNYRTINPFIKCICSYNNNTVCHITRLYRSATADVALHVAFRYCLSPAAAAHQTDGSAVKPRRRLSAALELLFFFSTFQPPAAPLPTESSPHRPPPAACRIWPSPPLLATVGVASLWRTREKCHSDISSLSTP
ncbi:hypothetical protein ABZP36_013288 [Zizania latifolia]